MWTAILTIGKSILLNKKTMKYVLIVSLAVGIGWGVKMVFDGYSDARIQLNNIENTLSEAQVANESLMRQIESLQEQREREQAMWVERQDKLEEIASQDREREVIIREVKDETEMQCVDAAVPDDVYNSLFNYATGSSDEN